MSATSSVTPTPTPSPATNACVANRSSIQWDGTTTACPPNAGCRTTTACSAIPHCRTTPTSQRRHQCPIAQRKIRRSFRPRSAAETSSSCATRSPLKMKRHLKNSSARSDFRLTGRSPMRPSMIAVVALPSARSFATLNATRLTKRKLQCCGMSTFVAQLLRPNLKIAKCRARITAYRSFAPITANRSTSKQLDPNFSVPALRSLPTPTMSVTNHSLVPPFAHRCLVLKLKSSRTN
ncbi:unannotated protein [freshwater metagenome]|uniref:Unannotated protein n=1 Tax=freshwater metagenome TaxID=449393 RepID=A0A6J6EUV8_9ZZZZ